MPSKDLAIFGGSPAVTIRQEFPWPIITEEEIRSVTGLLRDGLISDPGYCEPVKEFERRWAEYLGMEFALSRVDGSAALHSALFAAGVGPGDEAIIPSYTWIASGGCVLAAGAIPVFADIDRRTYTLDPADVARRITPRTRAIVAVHLWGHPADMDALRAIADERHLALIEDGSHAHGGSYKDRRIGTLGDIACFSFQASKALPTGEGGILVTNRRDYFERALLLAQSPGRLNLHLLSAEYRRFKDTGFGAFKYRMNPLNAAIGLVQMKYFEQRNAVRTRNLNHLTEQLRGIPGIRPPYTAPDADRGGFYGYPILYEPRELGDLPMDTFIEAMRAEGVPLDRERYPMLHLTPMYREKNPAGRGWPWSYSEEAGAIEYRPGDLPVTEDVYPRLLAIPAFNKAVPCEPLFDQYAEAFRKVAQSAPALTLAAAGI
jgi:perosamine synthetase